MDLRAVSEVGRPPRAAEDDVVDASPEPDDQPGRGLGIEEARVILDFAVGANGVGPPAGLDSGEFFPVPPVVDLNSDQPGEGDPDHR